MLYLLSIFGLLTLTLSEDDHAGHKHSDETVPDCSCTTGMATENLDCTATDFDTNLIALQAYLVDKQCDQYCVDNTYMGNMATVSDKETAFTCLQVWILLVQYHAYCISSTVNETLFHDYLEVCPDCNQDHYQYEGAVECDGSLNCTLPSAQEDAANYVINTCIDDAECTDECKSKFREVEGYHRMCAHHDITEDFDELIDQDPWDNTLCAELDIHCNVPEEVNHTINCSSSPNMQYMMLKTTYGPFDFDKLSGDSDTSGDHSGHILRVVMIGFMTVLFAVILVR